MVAISGTIERVLHCTINADAAGTVTLRKASDDVTIGTIAAGDRGFHAMFKDSASSTGILIRYEKMFFKNTHATLTLSNAAIKLTADPQSRIRVGCATAKDDTGSVANRLTAPASITYVDDNVSQSIPTGILAAAEEIGVWVEQNLPANDPAFKSSFTLQLAGTTT